MIKYCLLASGISPKGLAVHIFGLLAVIPLLDRAKITADTAVDFALLSLLGFEWAHIVLLTNYSDCVS